MSGINRREFIQKSAGASAIWVSLLQKALAVQAYNRTRSIKDVQHIVILMQENRSFDHYFGAMKGVRGFGDRFPIPLESGQRVFQQSDGKKIIPPYRADGRKSNAALVTGTPHDFHDTQAAWNQGKYGFWPLFKTPYSMAYYTREEIPFQYAMAESFTICDAYHCSVATGTDPNRIMFFSGSNFNPEKRAAGINSTDEDSEPTNVRCWIEGKMPEPGYTYRLNGFKWPTIPDVLQDAGISWRIYQDPNNNWTGAMHGCLAFDSFRNALPGSPVYENGMRHWSLEDLTNDVKNNKLPQVSWILPSQEDSEHPSAPSSPYHASDYTHKILTALTSNPEVWSKTIFFLTFDENDGFFDHLPAPAVPSYNADNSLAGKSTIELAGMYFHNDKGIEKFQDPMGKPGDTCIYQDHRDTITGNIRPWGLGPRVPMYIISPWSKGGWVLSEVADHTSVGQFIEKRFGVTIPAISPWHRAVCSDLTAAFDFETPNDPVFPTMPDTSQYELKEAASKILPKAVAPEVPTPLYQEKGVRFSRALPYSLNCMMQYLKNQQQVQLLFSNDGSKGAVYHVYDMHHLDAIPRRYTVEAGKSLSDEWNVTADGIYDLEVYGPNGYFQKYTGNINADEPQVKLEHHHKKGKLIIEIDNNTAATLELILSSNAYGYTKNEPLTVRAGRSVKKQLQLESSGFWYDFTLATNAGYTHRFAGRLETGKHSTSDPAMAMEL